MCIPVEINLTLIGLKREGGGGQVAYIGTEESWPWEPGAMSMQTSYTRQKQLQQQILKEKAGTGTLKR